jgi:predicted DNA binding CopG/RHH family protein
VACGGREAGGLLYPDDGPSQLISIKVPPSLLRAFKAKAQANGLKYQTQIKSLMKAWLLG